jgi:hypothetical protein
MMKNVSFNTKKKWIGTLDGTALGERGSDGSPLRNKDQSVPTDHQDPFNMAENPANQDRVAGQVAARFLNSEDRLQRLGEGVRNPNSTTMVGRAPAGQGCKWLPNADGILATWSAVVYRDTEDQFWEEWRVLMAKFEDQERKIYRSI